MRRGRIIVWAICVFALTVTGGGVFAQGPWPDMKGVWTMTSSSVVMGAEKHHPGSVERGTVRYREAKFTIRVTEQKDRRFAGTVESEHHKETLVGTFANNGKQIVMADSDGYFEAVMVDPNTIDYCYRHITPGSAVVACSVMKRQ